MSSGKSLLTLINDILDLSKIEAGKIDLQYEYVDIASLFYEMENFFSVKVKEKKLDLIIKVSPDLPHTVFMDEVRLRQVLINLVGNAVKFTDKGYVSLSISKITTYKDKREENGLVDICIEVEDTGMGIKEDSKESIFESFTQQDQQSTKKYGGTGLGLPISKRLIEMMKGTIGVESKTGVGSIFRICLFNLKTSQEKIKSETEKRFESDSILFEEATVLVVDDSEENRNYIISTLKNSKLNLLEADNGSMALKQCKETIPDLIITDLKMPVMNGLELLKSIRQDKKIKNVPVILATASVMQNTVEELKKNDFNGILLKPITISELYAMLIKYLPHSIVKAEAEDITSEIHLPDNIKEKIPEVLKELEGPVMKKWKTLEDQQAIDEVEEFSGLINNIGEKFSIELLIRYANDLASAINNFDIDEMLNSIKTYPELVNNLKKLV